MMRDSKLARMRSPAMVGASSLIGLLAAVEALIRAGLINRHVVPLPSQVLLALPRIIAEEDILGRFLMTAGEAAAAGLLLVAVAIPTGVLFEGVVPKLSVIGRGLADLLTSPAFYGNLQTTAGEVAIAIVIGSAAG